MWSSMSEAQDRGMKIEDWIAGERDRDVAYALAWHKVKAP